MIEDRIEKMKKQLRSLQNDPDVESAHMEADAFLCDLLRSLGFNQIVEEYHNVPKWYA